MVFSPCNREARFANVPDFSIEITTVGILTSASFVIQIGTSTPDLKFKGPAVEDLLNNKIRQRFVLLD